MGDRRIVVLVGAALASLLSVAALVSEPAPAQTAGCIELVQNTGFESDAAWTINVNGYPAGYATARAHSGARSMRLGLEGAANRSAFSSVQQQITIPATAASAILTFWVYPVAEASEAGDRQEAILLYPDGGTAAILWRTTSNAQAWAPLSFDLSAFRGQTLILYFNVFNDGMGGRATLYLDDVSLQVCDASGPTPIFVTATPTPTPIVVTATPTPIIVTATPTPTPFIIVVTNTPTPIVVTATPTPTTLPPLPPAGCVELIRDGGFEGLSPEWVRGRTPLFSVLLGPPFAHSGNVAVRLGNVDQPDTLSYSSVRQLVFLPYGVQVIRLSFWHYLQSDDAGIERDRQEVVLLDPVTYATISIPWRVTRNDRMWLPEMVDLTPFQGRIFFLYFNARNDGDGRRTAMYLDDVSLVACVGVSSVSAPIASDGALPGDTEAGLPVEVTATPMGMPTAIVVTPEATTEPVGDEGNTGQPPPDLPPSRLAAALAEFADVLPVMGASALFLGVTTVLAAIILFARREQRR
jgi:hypothetical protein